MANRIFLPFSTLILELEVSETGNLYTSHDKLAEVENLCQPHQARTQERSQSCPNWKQGPLTSYHHPASVSYGNDLGGPVILSATCLSHSPSSSCNSATSTLMTSSSPPSSSRQSSEVARLGTFDKIASSIQIDSRATTFST